jgi:cell fate (sporulation/competence/biofilm development) regulator YlbF (YheA/YmcA/DUF963 family)
MGDAGEGLIDADARIQERIDELEEMKKRGRRSKLQGDPEKTRQLESCKLARIELQRQLDATSHQARRQQLTQALEELERRISSLAS